ncbi:MAG: LacI family DNA-binding transcriptional regulator [Anaerolineales bacterium]|nr:LacI family DNA-binding transcriptional regulator [Anaerolineales bacterium]
MVNKPVRTIADIAELAGVSKSTVSRALSNSPLISEETRNRIQAIAREHNYQINQPARSLSMKRTNTIAFITHGYHSEFSVEDLFFMEMLGAIASTLAENNYDLLLVNVDPYKTDWINDYLNTGKVDGFILMTSTHKSQHVQKLIEVQAPFIAWGVPIASANYCTVTGDNLTGSRLATAHLLELGRRKIAFLGGPEKDRETQLRYEGFANTLIAAGLEPDQNCVVHGWFSRSCGIKGMNQLLDKEPNIDAVFCNSDFLAMGAIDVIRERGKRVPEDISVVGYDDISLAQYSNPPLTTIRQNINESGRLLVNNLIQYLETGIVTNVSVPVNLVVRESTMPG